MSKNKSDFILGQLLTGRQSYDWLLTSISLAPPCAVVNICSAFIKYPAMRNILNECPKSDGRVLVRWQKFDLFTGSIGIWTIFTGGTYAILGIIAAIYLRNKKNKINTNAK